MFIEADSDRITPGVVCRFLSLRVVLTDLFLLRKKKGKKKKKKKKNMGKGSRSESEMTTHT